MIIINVTDELINTTYEINSRYLRGVKMVEYKTIKVENISFGENNFLEVARKKAISEKGEVEFISISRGFVMQDGQKRYRQSLTVPDSKEVVEFIAAKLKEMV